MKLRLPRLLREDWQRKAVALFFAMLIWFAIDSQLREPVVFHNVPVEERYNPAQMTIENPGLAVAVTLRGSRKRLRRMQSNDIKIVVDVPLVPPGIYFFDMRVLPEDVAVPPGIRVTDVLPDQKQLQVDRVVTKPNVPIRVRFEGEPPEGYRRTRVTVFPSAVDIVGPSRILKDIQELVTAPVVLDQTTTQDFELDAKLVTIPRVEMNTEVHVRIEITKYSSERSYGDLPMHVLNSPASPLHPSETLPQVSVTLHGPRVTLETMDELSVRPFIDITGITSPGTYRRPVHVWIDGASSVTAEYVHPHMVEVVLVSKPAAGPAPAGNANAPNGRENKE
jgi:YbbR domain-containing protein